MSDPTPAPAPRPGPLQRFIRALPGIGSRVSADIAEVEADIETAEVVENEVVVNLNKLNQAIEPTAPAAPSSGTTSKS